MRLIALAALLLAACAPAQETTEVDNPAAAERTLDGEYVVTFVNEAEPVIGIEGSEPTVTIDATRIHFQSQCIYDDWSYTRDGESVTIGPWDYGEAVAMCARGLAPGETAISQAFDNADTVRFVRGGLWFSGEGGTVQLRRVPNADERAGRDVDLTGSWQVQALDGEVLADPLPLEADFEQVWWEPGCALQYANYRIDGSTFSTTPIDLSGQAVCDIGYPEELSAVWSAMDAADTIEETANGGVLISGSGRSVLLAPRAGGDE